MRNFDALPDVDRRPSCEFELGGRVWHARNANDVPITLINSAMNPDASGGFEIQVAFFFERAIVPAEVDAFMEMIHGPRSPLNAANVVPLMNFISEQVMKRPTVRPSRSAGGSLKTGQKSKDASSSRATTRRASTG